MKIKAKNTDGIKNKNDNIFIRKAEKKLRLNIWVSDITSEMEFSDILVFTMSEKKCTTNGIMAEIEISFKKAHEITNNIHENEP